jgi:hypothetical protein
MRGWVRAMGLMAAVLAAGCASTTLPPARPMQSGDLQRMGGMWAWTARLQSPATLGAGPLRVRLEEGRMRFETSSASGVLTLHEGDGLRVLDGQAVNKASGQSFPVQFTQRGSASIKGVAEAKLQWFALVIEN